MRAEDVALELENTCTHEGMLPVEEESNFVSLPCGEICSTQPCQLYPSERQKPDLR